MARLVLNWGLEKVKRKSRTNKPTPRYNTKFVAEWELVKHAAVRLAARWASGSPRWILDLLYNSCISALSPHWKVMRNAWAGAEMDGQDQLHVDLLGNLLVPAFLWNDDATEIVRVSSYKLFSFLAGVCFAFLIRGNKWLMSPTSYMLIIADELCQIFLRSRSL